MKTLSHVLVFLSLACSAWTLFQVTRLANLSGTPVSAHEQESLNAAQSVPVVLEGIRIPVDSESVAFSKPVSSSVQLSKKPFSVGRDRRFRGMGQFDASGNAITVTEVDNSGLTSCSGGVCVR